MNRRSFTKVLGLVAAAVSSRPGRLEAEPDTAPLPDETVVKSPVVAESGFGHRVEDRDLGKMTEPERREFFRIIERDAKDQLPFARTYFREYVDGERRAK